MTQITRKVDVGTQIGEAATGADKVPQQRVPTSRPQSHALAPIASGGAESASRADSTARASTFRYAAAGGQGGASDAAGFARAASSVRHMAALQPLIAEIVESAKANAGSKSGGSLEQHYQALETVAASVAKWPPLDADKGLRELLLAYLDMPQADQTSLGVAINTAYEKAFSALGTQLANQVHSAQSFVDKLGKLNDETRSWPGLARGVAIATFLEGVVDRLKTFPPDELAEGHQLLSDTITSSPRWVAEGADEKLCKLEANELLPPKVKAAFEDGERLAKAAGSIVDVASLHGLLLEPGIAGPDVPHDLLGLARMSQYDGNFHLPGRLRPDPLAVLATRVGSFTTMEANQHAFADIFDKVDTVQPPNQRIASLIALAGAASQLPDPVREQGYMRVLNTVCTLRANQEINSEQQALVLKALHRAITQHAGGDAGPAEQAALHALREEIRSRYDLVA